MADHNGDYSPEAEYKRKLKREKVQRSRIRARIEEGRATDSEIAAIDAWERGEPWALGATSDTPAPAQDRPPRAPRARKPAQASEPAPFPWKEVGIGGGIVAAFIGGILWLGRNIPPLA